MPLGPNPQSDTRVRGNLLGSPVLRFGLIQCYSPKQDPLDSMEGGRGRCYRPRDRAGGTCKALRSREATVKGNSVDLVVIRRLGGTLEQGMGR